MLGLEVYIIMPGFISALWDELPLPFTYILKIYPWSSVQEVSRVTVLTSHGVQDVSLLEVSQFGLLHHHYKIKTLCETS